jgi:acyl-CoA reductase-like NAD-dependent aldehyde dehydrogenase/predicted RNA polymerase sigma factor
VTDGHGQIEDLLRELAPQVLGGLVRRDGRFDACEDAVQEALLAAARQWPAEGVPENPRGWLATVAARRLVDEQRSEIARRAREHAAAAAVPADELHAPDVATAGPAARDDTLALLYLCCHPSLSSGSQVALTLRAVGGLTTAEIARAFLVPEATMAQRISRAKQRIREAGLSFGLPDEPDRPAHLHAVLLVLYLIFNEGHTASSGPELVRAGLATEAVRLTRQARRLLPGEGEVAGLLALMLLTDARRPARTGPAGELIPLAEQDRTRWDAGAIREGIALITDTLSWAELGPYQVQAAIAAVHAEAATAEDTDWPQILALYELLERLAPGPVVTLNRAVARAMVDGPRAGLALLEPLDDDARMAEQHRLHAVRAHLLELAGDAPAALASYALAARGTTSLPEQRYLEARSRRLRMLHASDDTTPGSTGMSTAAMVDTSRLYIDGAWVASASSETIPVVNPTTAEVIGSVPAGDAVDVDRAVSAARAAFEGWSQTPVAERAAFLRAISAGLAAAAEELAELAATDVGTPVSSGRYMHAKLPASTFASMADTIESFELETRDGTLLLVREPVGVVGCITPWNYPLHQLAAKVAPALATGCTVVVKPSEVAPLTAWRLAEIVEAAGLPAGVFNLVSGFGPVVGEALAAHPDVDMVSFTGSVRGGTRVAEVAAATVKRVTLELGGKSPNVVLDDVDDLPSIVAGAVSGTTFNAGQTCSALTRLIVPRARLGEVEELARAAAEATRVGDPALAETQLGPVVSSTQYDRVREYIEVGLAEGAKLVAGGTERPAGAGDGYFVAATVFSDVDNGMRIAQEEIFGPVLVVIPYDDEDEAVRIANDSAYGLSGGVWSGSAERAERVAKRMRTGQVKVNGGAFNPTAPFGGYKRSGIGRELGALGLEEFLETKALTF